MTVGLAYASGLDNLLEIGFGGGRTAWYLHKHMPALDITCVELDPAVVELAKKHFGVRAEDKFKIVVADGRSYMVKSKETWNVIMIDAYRGPFVPFHLLTEEFYKVVKSKLKPGGVVVQNIEPIDDDVRLGHRHHPEGVHQRRGLRCRRQLSCRSPTTARRRTAAQLSARAAALQKEHRLRLPARRVPAGARASSRATSRARC